MAYKVRWTAIAAEDYESVIDYLVKNWGVLTAESFITNIESRITLLQEFPFIGVASKIRAEIRSIVLTKHNLLYYRVLNDSIEILNIFDTRQNPEKNPYR
jgi:plasmid stabilization system protein ParE